jgi:hypothetical protein
MTIQSPSRGRTCLLSGLGGLILIILVLCGLFLVFSAKPALAAQGADVLRSVFGDEAVAKLEQAVFGIQDALQRMEFTLGVKHAQAPWQAATEPAPLLTVTPQAPSPTPSPFLFTSTNSGVSDNALKPTPGVAQFPTSSPPPSPTPALWLPAPAIPLGSLNGEGQWTPYIQDAHSQIVAYRTFLQPDPQRPYAIVGVVAFDLRHTRLHYVLGSEEPYSPDGPKRSGKMPADDLKPGFLLATFNGGFKTTHGKFGAMADGIVAIPPRDGLATIGIYKDGSVRIGEWGNEIVDIPDLVAWRQNGPLVIHQGQVNPQIFDNSPKDWGYTVDDVSPTWRSALAISPDEETLYFIAGPKMTMQALAQSMLAAGAVEGMQLDINNYWVHFVAIRAYGDKLVPEPLFPDAMTENLDRYLHPYSRDFFYVTSAP